MTSRWMQDRSPDDRSRAERLRSLFASLGVSDPDAWASSDASKRNPYLALLLILRRLWRDVIDGYDENTNWIDNVMRNSSRDPNGPFADGGQAISRLLALGAQREDITYLARMIAYESVFGVVEIIDEGYDPEIPFSDDLPCWILVEDDPSTGPTRRVVSGLHESLLLMNPSGRDGRPKAEHE